MNESIELRAALAEPFSGLPRNAVTHFKLWFYAAVLRLIERTVATAGSFDAAFESYPFLAGYSNQLADRGLAGVHAEQARPRWHDAVRAWEAALDEHLPLRALREALELGDDEIALLMTVGLPEEDTRFGALFESLNGAQGLRRPTIGLLTAWYGDTLEVPGLVRRLLAYGLLEANNTDAPRAEWQLAVPDLVWEAVHGTLAQDVVSWALLWPAHRLHSLDALLFDEDIGLRLEGIANLLAQDNGDAVVVRGPSANGRRTLLGALAQAAGRGVLEIRGLAQPGDSRWRVVGAVATLLHAMPVIVAQPAPGETVEIPDLPGYAGPIGIAMGKLGGLSGDPVRHAISLELDIPTVAERKLHWAAALDRVAAEELDAITAGFRLTRGNIRRAAALAVRQAALDGRATVSLDNVRAASRSLNREALETLATRVTGRGDWNHLAAPEHTFADLRELEVRCRYRESLGRFAGGAAGVPNPGVRALFKGPSGTGKTLAARLLANVLGMDVYRIDLAAVVNKYIGETEKNLEQAFSRAEELDVILLLDEGDALLTRRTDVSTANDRYANLETNYLLQRIESYAGILIVTTNAGDRIDGSFARRMDVVVDFTLPQAEQRWSIWLFHLPAGHAVDQGLLWDVAERCALSGGQIRNAALHAALLALERGGAPTGGDVVAAVQREYRKSGAVCPLRSNY